MSDEVVDSASPPLEEATQAEQVIGSVTQSIEADNLTTATPIVDDATPASPSTEDSAEHMTPQEAAAPFDSQDAAVASHDSERVESDMKISEDTIDPTKEVVDDLLKEEPKTEEPKSEKDNIDVGTERSGELEDGDVELEATEEGQNSPDALLNPSAKSFRPMTTIREIEAVETLSYHRDADLSVKVKDSYGNIKIYEVSSANLATASLIWRKMVYGRDRDNETIEMLDDSAFALDILFQVIHYKFYEIPDRPSINELFEIATVADKYDCIHLLVPWTKRWAIGLNRHAVMASTDNDDDKTLWIAWVFGDAKWFPKAFTKAANKMAISKDGDLVDISGRSWKDSSLPTELLELMAATRLNTLKAIVQAIRDPMDAIMHNNTQVSFCHAKDVSTHTGCQAMQLGSAMAQLTLASLYPLPSPEEYMGSAASLAGKLNDINVMHFQIPGAKPHLDEHAACGFQHKSAMEKALTTPASWSDYPHVVNRLILQARKAGLFDEKVFGEHFVSVTSDKTAADAKFLEWKNTHEAAKETRRGGSPPANEETVLMENK